MKWHLAYVDWLILDVSCLKNLVSSRASFCIDRFKSNYTQAIYWQSVEIENHNFLSWYLEVCPVKMQKCVLKWDRKYDLIYMKDSEIGPVPQTCPIILWRQISTWESKNKPDSIVMSNSPKHVRFGPTNVPDFTKKQQYLSIFCMFTILSVFQCYYCTIKP